ncbi:NADH-quinone oxidoreductase subunit NuoN [Bacillus solimangrovi]|uniref:NADH-quinone oxidoreductase subunit N n=1 Tax=Bacillus solimangrovi TaxID=1305675 RepID=A0A1E5LGX5_9BACI|nr:NADH-quinone oxidoreductase subunit NuoN [Bacillus solimangrovi]OEH93329.1 NADH-quinone oxidoreductase subunit N [Bacillus solimangrovi]
MDLETLLSYQWGAMAPEFVILGVATLLSLLDLFMSKDKDRKKLAWVGLGGIIIALIFLLGQLNDPVTIILHETYRLDSFAKAFKLIFLVGGAFVFLIAASYEPKEGLQDRGEFYYLFLTAMLGAMMMASSADLITLYVGLELLSLSSYILVGLRKKNKQSNEAALKYVINGGISTAITLFGMSYIYGLSGSTNLYEISNQLGGLLTGELQYIASIAFLMMFVGLSFKIAAVPFQMWAPDVYQGAPTPVTAFLSVISKTAGFVIILRLFVVTFIQAPGIGGQLPLIVSMQSYLAVIAGVTIIIGNTIALKQHNMKRLFAYSSIAHAGYLIVPFVAFSAFMFESIWFYLIAYLFMNLGAFALLQVMIKQSDSEDVTAFAGLYERSPWLAILMSIFILSLAGIPGTMGFIGKFNIFVGILTARPSHYMLAALMMTGTVISYFYYFKIMQQMFFRRASQVTAIKLPVGITVVVVLCALGTLLFGILPNVAMDFFYESFNFTDFFSQ